MKGKLELVLLSASIAINVFQFLNERSIPPPPADFADIRQQNEELANKLEKSDPVQARQVRDLMKIFPENFSAKLRENGLAMPKDLRQARKLILDNERHLVELNNKLKQQ